MQKSRLFLLALVAVVCAMPALAQTTSSLSGVVTSGGSALPGVTVTISSPALQGVRTTVTSEAGAYSFGALPPGAYSVRFELTGMAPLERRVTLQLAQPSRVDAALQVSSITEAITVTAEAPAVLETTDVARNYTQESIAELPVTRNIRDTVLLSPGVSNNGARGNISISGSPSYDNLFLVNGVTVNENLRGQPHDLFIEDAIQETTVLTGAVSAEYGRFSGGVVNLITKSGGNAFNGSLRDTLTNASWIAKTPIEKTDHPDKTIGIYEGTLGGYILKDRLWFFGAGRKASGAPAVGIDPTGSTVSSNPSLSPLTFQNTVDEKRWEGKLTAQVLPQHSIVLSYLDIDKTESNNYFAPIYDQESIVTSRSLPNSLEAASYNGVITTNFLIEAQYSKKEFAFINSGGRFTDQIRGTWIADTNARWNAPVFCGVCTPERRDNDSIVAKGTYFLTTGMGAHSIVVGGEQYHETRLVNNFQSASQFQITSTGTAIMTGPSTNQIFPRFDTGTTLTWRPILELSQGSDLKTRSAFINDKWNFKNFSFNIGLRYDKNDAVDASGNVVSDDSAFSPRLGATYDIKNDGRYQVNASYSHYVTKIVDGNVGGGAAGAGNPANFNFRYGGPVVNPAGTPAGALVNTPEALAILFNWFNGLTPEQKAAALTSATIPGLSTQVPEPISSPYVREIVLGFGSRLGSTAFARVDLINRDWHDFYATRLDTSTGRYTGTNPVNGATTTGDRAVLINDDHNISRKYRGIQVQANWRPNRFSTGLGYTWSKLTGNDVPEGDGTAAITNTFGQFYPEYLNYENRLPSGYITGDQRHRARIWGSYDLELPLGIRLTPSVIQSYDSGRAFSATGNIDAYGSSTPFANSPYSKENNGANSPYSRSQLGTSHTYYFGGRGQFRTDAVTATDVALNLDVPVSRIHLFTQFQVLNVWGEDNFNDIYLSRIDTTVRTRRTNGASSGLAAFNPYTDVPKECPQGAPADQCTAMGANYQLGPNFGKPVTKDAYQTPRTYRVAFGLRF